MSLFYAKDHLGSVRELTNSSGTRQAQYNYGAWGEKSNIDTEIVPSDFGYAGMYVHQRSGLNLRMFRAYSPILGRWLSRDPIGESMGTNLYAYAGNNPVNFLDPLGLRYSTPADPTEGAEPMGGEEFLAILPIGKIIDPLIGLAGKGLAGLAANIAPKAATCPVGRFAQRTASPLFSEEGKFAGKSISDVARALRSGTMAPEDVPVQYIIRDGNRLIVNTRSSLALKQAGIPEAQWNWLNQTGNPTVEAAITQRLFNNRLGSSGTETLRITGSGPNASTLMP